MIKSLDNHPKSDYNTKVRFRMEWRITLNKHAYKRLAKVNGRLKAIDDTYRNIAKIFGMPECTFWILYTLRVEENPLTQSEICNSQYQPKQTVNSALKKMEIDGYIKLICGSNQRSKNICLTEKGIRLAEKTVDKVSRAEAEALIGLSDEEQEEFVNLLKKYSGLLKEKMQALNMGKEIDV